MALDKVPGTYISISDTRVTTPSSANVKALIIGIKLAGGTLAVNTPTQITSDSAGVLAGGDGSQLAAMIKAFRAQARGIDLTVVAVTAAVSAAATGTITFSGTATTAQPLLIRVEDETISVPVAIGDAGSDVAASVDTVLSASEYDFLHASAGAAAAVVTFTAKSHGIHGNDINIEIIDAPPGISGVVVAMSGGTGSPDVDSALSALGGVRYNYIVLPDVDATNLADVKTFLDARWTEDEAIDGHAIVGKRDTVSNLATLGNGLDDKHLSVIGDPNVPTSPWNQAAAIAAARADETNPKKTIRKVPLTAIVAPDETSRLTPDEKQTLLAAGISVYWYVQGYPRIDRFVTTAKTNDDGLASDAYYDVETKLTVSAIRQDRMILFAPEIGKILVDDAGGTEYDLSVADSIIDAEGIRTLMIAQYNKDFQPLGWVSDPSGFADDLVVAKTDSVTITWTASDRINGILYTNNGSMQFQLATG